MLPDIVLSLRVVFVLEKIASFLADVSAMELSTSAVVKHNTDMVKVGGGCRTESLAITIGSEFTAVLTPNAGGSWGTCATTRLDAAEPL